MDTKLKHPIEICRVYEPPGHKQGVWILVDRLWPRGLRKEAVAFDSWLKDMAPSPQLRQWFHQDPEQRWDEFAKSYVQELSSKVVLMEQVQAEAKHGPVTLFYAAKSSNHNHALILQAMLYSWPKLPVLIA